MRRNERFEENYRFEKLLKIKKLENRGENISSVEGFIEREDVEHIPLPFSLSFFQDFALSNFTFYEFKFEFKFDM